MKPRSIAEEAGLHILATNESEYPARHATAACPSRDCCHVPQRSSAESELDPFYLGSRGKRFLKQLEKTIEMQRQRQSERPGFGAHESIQADFDSVNAIHRRRDSQESLSPQSHDDLAF